MDYNNGFILQKAVDWSLLRSISARLLPSGRKNYYRIIHKDNPMFNRRKFQFEFEKIASKQVPCKHVCIWPSVSNLSNGEVLRLKLYEHLKVG